MRLTALEASFVRHEAKVETYTVANDPSNYPAGGTHEETGPTDYFIPVATLADAHGIDFVCPKGLQAGDAHHVRVYFAGSPVPARLGKNKNGDTVRWTASGTGLEDLTLQPSIHEQDDRCGWHGHVTNGDAA